MNIKKFFFPSLLVGAVVALILQSFTKRASAKPNTNDTPNDATASYDAIDGAPATRFTRRLVELIESGYGLDEAVVH